MRPTHAVHSFNDDSRSLPPAPSQRLRQDSSLAFAIAAEQALAFVQSGLCEVASSDARACVPATSHNPPDSRIVWVLIQGSRREAWR